MTCPFCLTELLLDKLSQQQKEVKEQAEKVQKTDRRRQKKGGKEE